MSDFKAKMHRMRFRLRLCHIPAGGAYSAPSDLLTAFPVKGDLLLRGRVGKGMVVHRREGQGYWVGKEREKEGRAAADVATPLKVVKKNEEIATHVECADMQSCVKDALLLLLIDIASSQRSPLSTTTTRISRNHWLLLLLP